MTDDPTDTPLPPYQGIDGGGSPATPPSIPTDPGTPFPSPDDLGVPPGPAGGNEQHHEGIHVVCNNPNAAQSVKDGNSETCSLYPGNVPVVIGPASDDTSHVGIGVVTAVVLSVIIAGIAAALLYFKNKGKRVKTVPTPRTEEEAFAEDVTTSKEFDEVEIDSHDSESDIDALFAVSDEDSEEPDIDADFKDS